MGLALLRAPAEHGGVVHDHAAPPLHHVRQHGARHPEDAVQRDVEDRRPLIVAHVDDVDFAAEPGVVDHHVDPTHVLDGRRHERAHVGVVADIAEPMADGLPRDLGQVLRGFRSPLGMDVADEEPRTFLGAALCRRESDARPRSSRHQDGLAAQQVVGRDVGRRRRLHGSIGHGSGSPLQRGSRGRPSTRSDMMLRWIWFEPA